MIRKTIRFEKRQAEKLKRLARERGVTESQIVREAIDGVDNVPFEPDPDAVRQLIASMRATR
jgi:predicted transcriptional regulator